MSEIARICGQLRRAHEGGAWHGPSLNEILKDVNAKMALFRLTTDSHSIWEIFLHIDVWETVVRRRLSGEVVQSITAEQDWPAVTETSDSAWKSTIVKMRNGHELLQQAVARLADRQLEEPVPEMGYNVYAMLHGIIQHTLYHAGQIAILKKAAHGKP